MALHGPRRLVIDRADGLLQRVSLPQFAQRRQAAQIEQLRMGVDLPVAADVGRALTGSLCQQRAVVVETDEPLLHGVGQRPSVTGSCAFGDDHRSALRIVLAGAHLARLRHHCGHLVRSLGERDLLAGRKRNPGLDRLAVGLRLCAHQLVDVGKVLADAREVVEPLLGDLDVVDVLDDLRLVDREARGRHGRADLEARGHGHRRARGAGAGEEDGEEGKLAHGVILPFGIESGTR